MTFLFGKIVVLSLFLGAHPVPKENHDRRILIRTSEAGVEILYRLEVDETRSVLDLVEHDVDLNSIKTKEDLHRHYLDLIRRKIQPGLILKGPGGEIPLKVTRGETHLTDHLRVDLLLEASRGDLPQGALFTLEEANYAEDTRSLLQMALWPGLKGPPGNSPARTIRFLADWNLVEDDSRVGGKAVSGELGHEDGLLDLLLGGNLSLPVLLLFSMLFGAGHALTPGHGKTMVAAYLVGERGTVSQAILLGFVTTLTHTLAVLIVAGVLPWLVPDASSADVQRALNLIGGSLLCGMGFWLLLTRLTGGADHFHGPGGHSHGPPPAGTGTWGVIILGITGGLVPCWDAVAMLVFAMASGKVWMALPLLLAFSAGLALVLVALGISVVKSRDLIQRNVVSSGKFELWTGRIALVSACLIAGMGLWLCHKAAVGA